MELRPQRIVQICLIENVWVNLAACKKCLFAFELCGLAHLECCASLSTHPSHWCVPPTRHNYYSHKS